MNVVVVFLAVAFWAWLWSVIGVLIAVPLLVAVRVFCEHIPQLAAVSEFLSARRTADGRRPAAAGASPTPTH